MLWGVEPWEFPTNGGQTNPETAGEQSKEFAEAKATARKPGILRPPIERCMKKAVTEAISGALSETDVAAVVATSGKTNSGLIQDRAKRDDRRIAIKRSLSGGRRRCPNISYYQADLIENKHDSAAIVDAMGQVYKCDPSLGPQSDRVAESIMRSSVRRALMIGNQSQSSGRH